MDDYERLAKQLALSGMYAEMNSGCYRRSGCELGMNADLIQALKRHSVRILTASDAHCPGDVGAGIVTMEKMIME